MRRYLYYAATLYNLQIGTPVTIRLAHIYIGRSFNKGPSINDVTSGLLNIPTSPYHLNGSPAGKRILFTCNGNIQLLGMSHSKAMHLPSPHHLWSLFWQITSPPSDVNNGRSLNPFLLSLPNAWGRTNRTNKFS